MLNLTSLKAFSKRKRESQTRCTQRAMVCLKNEIIVKSPFTKGERMGIEKTKKNVPSQKIQGGGGAELSCCEMFLKKHFKKKRNQVNYFNFVTSLRNDTRSLHVFFHSNFRLIAVAFRQLSSRSSQNYLVQSSRIKGYKNHNQFLFNSQRKCSSGCITFARILSYQVLWVVMVTKNTNKHKLCSLLSSQTTNKILKICGDKMNFCAYNTAKFFRSC